MKPQDVEPERVMFGELAGVGASYAMLAQEQAGQFPGAADSRPRQCFRLSANEWEPALIPKQDGDLNEDERRNEELSARSIIVFNLSKAIDWLEAEIVRVQRDGLV